MSVLMDMIKEHVTDCCGMTNIELPDELAKLVLNLESRAIGAGIVEASLSHAGSEGRAVTIMDESGNHDYDGIFHQWGTDSCMTGLPTTVGIIEHINGFVYAAPVKYIQFTDVEP